MKHFTAYLSIFLLTVTVFAGGAWLSTVFPESGFFRLFADAVLFIAKCIGRE